MGEANVIERSVRGDMLRVPTRPGASGSEMVKLRPWSLLAESAARRAGIGICVPMTHAKRRVQTASLVEGDAAVPPSYFDTQQLWTLDGRFFSRAWDPRASPEALARVDEQLDRYLAFAEGPRTRDLCQGLVVRVRLQAPEPAASPWRRSLAALLGREPDLPGTWELETVIVSHDDYSRRTMTPPPLPLVTVVPLVRPWGETHPDAVRVAPPGDAEHERLALSAIALTLDPRGRMDDGQPLFVPDQSPADRWVVADEARREILRQVRQAAGQSTRP